MNKNTVIFSKGFVVAPDNGQDNKIMVSTVNSELMQMGFMLTQDAFEALSKSDPSFIVKWIEEVMEYLRHYLPKGNEYKMLHSGFPTSVMDMEIEELYFKAILHYWSEGTLYFEDKVTEKYSFEHVKYNMIKSGTQEDFKNIFKSLAQVNTALTPKDFAVIEWYIKNGEEYNMPSDIPFKENLCMLAGLGIDVPVKTATDVLRIAAYLSHGDSSLILPPKKVKESTWSRRLIENPERKLKRFKLSKSQRRIVMSLLNKVLISNKSASSEMKERHKMWNKLAHHIHPSDYAEDYTFAAIALRAMNSSDKAFKSIKTFYSRLAEATTLAQKLKVLQHKPGILARKLNELILKHPHQIDKIFYQFEMVGEKISNKVLFELWTYFEGRTKAEPNRKVFVKGARRATPLPQLPVISEDVVDSFKATIWRILSNKAKALPSLGITWIDPNLKKIPLPTNMRTLSDSLHVTIRGQRNPLIVEKKVLRFYLFWTAGVDLDLSCVMLSKDGDQDRCSYSRLRPHPAFFHSGDVIPYRTGKHAEYIDINISSAAKDYDYGLMTVHNFAGGKLNDVGALAGFMERDRAESDKTWRPDTVSNAFNFNGTGSNVALILIDFKTKEWMLIDMDMAGTPMASSTNILEFVTGLSEDPKVSVYDLLKLHAEARGKIVGEENIEDAETLFNFDDFSKSYEEIVKYMI
jgi:hypothetical protein